MYQVREIQPTLNLPSDLGTWQFKLPRAGAITALEIFVDWTNGATSTKDKDIYDAISRISVVANGSNYLYSLTGTQALKWTHAFMKKRPSYVRNEGPAQVQRAHIIIPFGMDLMDRNYFLKCDSWQDLELRIEYNPGISATTFATGAGYVTVFAHMWIGNTPGEYRGTVKLTEQYYFTSAAAGDEFYDFPLGNPFLALGLFVYELAVAPEANITDFQLNVDNGSDIPVSGDFENLNALFTRALKIDPTEYGTVYKSDTDSIETRTGTVLSVVTDTIQTLTIGTTDMTHTTISSYAGGTAVLQSSTRDVAAVAADAANVTDGYIRWVAVPQYGLGNMLIVPFGWPENPDLAMITSGLGRVRAIMSQGNAGAECRLSLMELVKPR